MGGAGGDQKAQDEPEGRAGLAPLGLAFSLCPEQKAEGGWPWRPRPPRLAERKHRATEWQGTPGRDANPWDGQRLTHGHPAKTDLIS